LTELNSSGPDSTASTTDADSPQINCRDDSAKLLPYAQLGLRLLGVLLFVDGIGAVTGGTFYAVILARAYARSGYAYTWDAHSIGWIASGCPLIAAGIYLMLDGKWVLKKIFSPVSRNEQYEET
jgi:hypothetical protein